ncbi:MAG: choice-of-anchor Q domain-containing protein, partial [Paludibacter sp.]
IKFINNGNNLYNCTIANNANPSGYALAYSGKVGIMTNCIFWGNTGAGPIQGVTTAVVATYNATDNVVINGAAGSGNNIKTLTTSPNNTFTSPTGFAGVSTDATTKSQVASADWSLKSGCLAINTGTDLSGSGVTTDILGNARPIGAGAVDMGAYEFTKTAAVITWSQILTTLHPTQIGQTVSLTATSNSDASITYESSDLAVVSVSGNTLTIVGMGNATVTAKQATNNYYNAATDVIQNVKVDYATQLADVKDAIRCYSSNQNLNVEGLQSGENVSVYSISGQLVTSKKALNSTLSFNLSKGVYLVRIENIVRKVVVR